ncbi:MAG: hypothetical protein EXS14_07940 [Planctomycetes bacterium]|nr:hypothetical protein [Planctomycetota bacterium]
MCHDAPRSKGFRVSAQPNSMNMALEGSASAGVRDITRPQARRILLLVLLLALGVRILGCFDGGLPWTFYKDEENNVERALRFAAEGTMNPKWFNKPALGYYILLGEYGAYYGVGRLLGRFTGPDDFAVQWFRDPQPLLIIGRINAAIFGTLGIWLTYLLARRMLSRRLALAAAAALAAMMGHVASSQEVKKDVVAAAFAIAASISMFDMLRFGRVRDYVRCGLLAGLSMATKYYAVALFVPFLCAHLFRSDQAKILESRAFNAPRLWWGMFLFWVGFFCGSPWNFISAQFWNERVLPQFRFMLSRLHLDQLWQGAAGPGAGIVDPAAHSLLDSALYTAERCFSAQGMGVVLAALMVFGAFAALQRSRRLRQGDNGALWLLLVTCVCVGAAAAFANIQFSEPRHLNTLYPFAAILVACGIAALADALCRIGGRETWRGRGALMALCLIVLVPLPQFPALVIVQRTIARRNEDPRVSALRWMEHNVAAGSVVLNDRDWVPLQPSAARCEKVLEQIGRLRDDAERHRSSAEMELDPTVRSRRLTQALASIQACEGYQRRWQLLKRAAGEAPNATWDVISLDQDWYTEDLNNRLQGASGYSPLPLRSPLGHVMREVLVEASASVAGVNSTWIWAHVDQHLTDLLRRDATQIVAALKPLPDDPQAAIAERVEQARIRFGLGSSTPNLALLWSRASPVSARWLTRNTDPAARNALRGAAWLVTCQHNYEAFGNANAARKAANFPDWAAFYADVAAHYDAWEFGTGSSDNRRIIRIYDLRTRTDAPQVRHP